MDSLIAQESTVRFCVLAAAIVLVATWEGRMPRRPLTGNLRRRWVANFAMWLIGGVLTRVAAPALNVGVAAYVARRGGGVLAHAQLPAAITFVVSFLALDFAQYAQHWLFHRIEPLWRVHRVHHADDDYDFTVALRFHPIEALVSVGVTLVTVTLLGPSVWSVLAYQLATAANSIFVHGNVALPSSIDSWLRSMLVTPDMHRVHHSATMRESGSNLGGIFPWWDRLLGTYVDQPAAGHERMIIGLGEGIDPRHTSIAWMLIEPFRRLGPPQRSADRRRPLRA